MVPFLGLSLLLLSFWLTLGFETAPRSMASPLGQSQPPTISGPGSTTLPPGASILFVGEGDGLDGSSNPGGSNSVTVSNASDRTATVAMTAARVLSIALPSGWAVRLAGPIAPTSILRTCRYSADSTAPGDALTGPATQLVCPRFRCLLAL